MSIKQIKAGLDNFSYILFDEQSKYAAVVDPSVDIKKQVDFINSKNLNLKYIIHTHYHIDHTAKSQELKEFFVKSKIMVSKLFKNELDPEIYVKVSDGSEFKLGNIRLEILLTPGHTPDGLCIIVDNKAILTGDTLFIDDCGRADLPGGNISDLFNSLQRIKKLQDEMIIYPGHNYANKAFDTLINQKKTNNTLVAKNLSEFSKI